MRLAELLEHGAPEALGARTAAGGASALALAAEHGHTACVELLVAARADVNEHYGSDAEVSDLWGACVPIAFFPAYFGYLHVVDALLAAKADANAASSGGMPLLFAAAFMGHPEVVERLCKASAGREYVEDLKSK